MNHKLRELALAVGGSHYAEVSEQYLETTVRRVIDHITQDLAPDCAQVLCEVYLGKFDLR